MFSVVKIGEQKPWLHILKQSCYTIDDKCYNLYYGNVSQRKHALYHDVAFTPNLLTTVTSMLLFVIDQTNLAPDKLSIFCNAITQDLSLRSITENCQSNLPNEFCGISELQEKICLSISNTN